MHPNHLKSFEASRISHGSYSKQNGNIIITKCVDITLFMYLSTWFFVGSSLPIAAHTVYNKKKIQDMAASFCSVSFHICSQSNIHC